MSESGSPARLPATFGLGGCDSGGLASSGRVVLATLNGAVAKYLEFKAQSVHRNSVLARVVLRHKSKNKTAGHVR